MERKNAWKKYSDEEIPGAFFSALGWYLFTALYSLYVDHSPNFSYMYGSLATIIIALIYQM